MTSTPLATDPKKGPRRELKTRQAPWAQALGRLLCQCGFSPNAISLLSIVFAMLALAAFLLAPEMDSPEKTALCWFLAAVSIQLRLLCNLLDGLVAIEGGKATATGPIYNEAPDRLADVFILVGAGYSTAVEPGVIKLFDALPLGWACAVLAMGTAYIRLLQGTLTGQQSFIGPMAKQHRMAVLTVATLVSLVEQLYSPEIAGPSIHGLKFGLILIFFGSLITCGRRLLLISHQLRKPPSSANL